MYLGENHRECHDFHFHSKVAVTSQNDFSCHREILQTLFDIYFCNFEQLKPLLHEYNFFGDSKFHIFCKKFVKKASKLLKKIFLTPPPRGMLRSSWNNPLIAQRRQLVYLDLGKNNQGHTYHSFFKKCENVPFLGVFWSY